MRSTPWFLAAMGVFALTVPALAQPYPGYREPAEGSPQMQREIDRQNGYRDDRRDDSPGARQQDRDDRRGDRMRREVESSREWLKEAQEAVRRGNLGQANEFLERAATRMLSGSTEPSHAREPMNDNRLRHINDAREALWHRNRREAARQIDMAIASR